MARTATIVRRPASSGGSRAASVITRYRTRTVAIARRGGSAVAKRAWERRALIAAPVVGFIMAKAHTMDIPTVPGLGRNGTIAAVATIAAMLTRNEWAQHIAAATLAVASYELTSTGTLAGDDEGGIP